MPSRSSGVYGLGRAALLRFWSMGSSVFRAWAFYVLRFDGLGL